MTGLMILAHIGTLGVLTSCILCQPPLPQMKKSLVSQGFIMVELTRIELVTS